MEYPNKSVLSQKLQTVFKRKIPSKGNSSYINGKSLIERSFFGFIFFLLLLILIQLMMGILTVDLILIECSCVLLILTIIIIHIRLKEKNFKIKTELVGYFVLNELILILNTSKSLKEATSFVVKGDYEIFSDLFRNAVIDAHFGLSLGQSLLNRIDTINEGELKRIFTNIIDNWENSDGLSKISNKMIINNLSEQIIEETGKIETWGSLFSGLFFLSPPIILCFLILSGNMSYIIGIILLVSVLFGTYFFKPDRLFLSILDESPIVPFTEKESLKFFVILAEHLINGLPFKNSLNLALNVYLKNLKVKTQDSVMESIVSFRLGFGCYNSTNYNEISSLFSSRTIQIIILIEKFSQINSKLAGSKLLNISEELNRINSLLTVGRAKIKAISFQRNFLKFFSIISLGFIGGASDLFQLVSQSFDFYTVNGYSYHNYDFLFLLFGIIFCFLPFDYHLINRSLKSKKLFSKENMNVIFHLIVFLVSFIFSRFLIKIPF